MPADLMALVGVVVLLGLTVNPAILLVDRMQQRVLGRTWTSGAAALAAVRERTRPVLMTSATTIVGLWPLAIATGRENEIWPPFATVVMGGLATSTLLTLLVIPVGFVLLSRLDAILGRLGPWLVLGLILVTTAVMAPLISLGLITTLTWQIITTLLVAGLLLTVIVLAMRPREVPEPHADEGPPSVEVRFLRKVYGRPGPVGRAWRAGERFAERVHERGGVAFVPREAWERVQALAVVLVGAGYLALWLESMWWRVVFSQVAAVLAARLVLEVRRARGRHDHLGRVLPGGVEGVLAPAMPWLAVAGLALGHTLQPWLAGQPIRLPVVGVVCLAAVVLLLQLGRHSATAQARGLLAGQVDHGPLHRTRTAWRRLSRKVLGLDLPRSQVEALATVHLEVRHGMVGILGPNGAGKTTLLRLLAGVLEPSLGTIRLGGVRTREIRRHLGRWVGYLPQELGLPGDLTAREYLSYYALLYEIRPASARRARVQRLLDEVGLGERCDERIGSYSGGMRQRVAVARTLLRLPPVIIVDEPTVGLDPRERIRFRNLLARLAEGRVVLFSTHVVEDVAVACERVVVMARGVIVFDGEPADLADEAQGRVWQVELSTDDADAFESGSGQGAVVDRVPQGEARARLRALAGSRPHPEARPQEPTLEDGYLWLVRSHRQAEAAQ
jgi:ABC-type multidrug transport system ATPase subunit